jgi:chemotaxis signal transduction protein
LLTNSDTEILDRRARALAAARPVEIVTADAGSSARYLVATCGGERLAILLTSVAEVYRPVGVTPLPRPRPPVWGLAAWRGRILTIAKVGEYAPDAGAGLVAVLSEGAEVFAGIWVNDVEGEITIAVSEITEPQNVSSARREFVSGVTANAVSILDAGRLKSALDRQPSAAGETRETNSTRETG